jgi:hypothetical protein
MIAVRNQVLIRRLLKIISMSAVLVSFGVSASTASATAPSIESESVSNVTPTSATLEAEIDPQGAPHGVFYQFQLLLDPGEAPTEMACPSSPPPGYSVCVGPYSPDALPIDSVSGTGPHLVTLDLSSAGVSLEPGRTYYYRLLAAPAKLTEDSVEWEPPASVGQTKDFTTPNPPSIESESASNITQTNATLGAEINLHEAPAGVYYQFQLVTDPSEYASEILCPPEPSSGPFQPCIGTHSAGALPIGFLPGNTLQPGATLGASLDLASAGVTLQPGTTYHYRVLAARAVQTEDTIEWEAPTIHGADQTFTTPKLVRSCPFSGCPGNPGNGPPANHCKKGQVKRHGKCVRKRHCRPKHHLGYRKLRKGFHKARTCSHRYSASHLR